MAERNRYILSDEAGKDVDEIFDYGLVQFGFSQALSYLENMHYMLGSFRKINLLGDHGQKLEVVYAVWFIKNTLSFIKG